MRADCVIPKSGRVESDRPLDYPDRGIQTVDGRECGYADTFSAYFRPYVVFFFKISWGNTDRAVTVNGFYGVHFQWFTAWVSCAKNYLAHASPVRKLPNRDMPDILFARLGFLGVIWFLFPPKAIITPKYKLRSRHTQT